MRVKRSPVDLGKLCSCLRVLACVRVLACALLLPSLVGCAVESETAEPIARASEALQVGPCTFTTPNQGQPVDRELSFKLPAGVASTDVALGTTGGELKLDPRVLVLGSTGSFAAVSSVEACSDLWLGNRA